MVFMGVLINNEAHGASTTQVLVESEHSSLFGKGCLIEAMAGRSKKAIDPFFFCRFVEGHDRPIKSGNGLRAEFPWSEVGGDKDDSLILR